MDTANLTNIVLSIAAISLGAFLGALGNKLVTYNSKTGWKWGFYIFSILSLIFVFIFPFIKKDLVFEDYFGYRLY